MTAASRNRWVVYQRVAELHATNIDQGFLSSLGLRFLALLYRAIDESPSSVLLVAEHEGRIIGFISGGIGMRAIYSRMLRHWPQLLLALIPTLISPRRLLRIIEILRYSAGGVEAVAKLPHAELLSLAVDRAFRGQRYAEILYQRLAAYFEQHGIPEFKITVGSTLEPAHRFYRKMGAEPVAELELHPRSHSVIYVQHSTVVNPRTA